MTTAGWKDSLQELENTAPYKAGKMCLCSTKRFRTNHGEIGTLGKSNKEWL